MTDDVRFSVLRRKLLAGLGAAAIGGVTASAVGRAAPAPAQESERGAVVPSILAFDVNDSPTSGTWRHCLNGCSATGSW
jgi:hypothetical protein